MWHAPTHRLYTLHAMHAARPRDGTCCKRCPLCAAQHAASVHAAVQAMPLTTHVPSLVCPCALLASAHAARPAKKAPAKAARGRKALPEDSDADEEEDGEGRCGTHLRIACTRSTPCMLPGLVTGHAASGARSVQRCTPPLSMQPCKPCS